MIRALWRNFQYAFVGKSLQIVPYDWSDQCISTVSSLNGQSEHLRYFQLKFILHLSLPKYC